MNKEQWKKELNTEEYTKKLEYIYSCTESETDYYKQRYYEVLDGLCENFGEKEDIRLFSAPGRTEIGGNHTDHQHGCVLAASLNLDIVGAVSKNGTNKVRVLSKGYTMDVIDLNDLEINEKEYDKAISLIRGILRRFKDLGYKLEGFDAYTISSVLKGSGMSSSAAFEVLIGTILSKMFANDEVDAVEIAKISKYAEHVYYNKPSGLMDQMASSVGNVVSIDFKSEENPVVKRVDFNFAKCGYSLCIIDSGANHADLTDEYAAVTREMRKISDCFGKEYLRDVDESEFYKNIADVRQKVQNDRAVLRAMHYFDDTKRAVEEANALSCGDFNKFLKLITDSGLSSFTCLQNIYASGHTDEQAVSLTLAMCKRLLNGKGAYRVHGGGFAGTVQAFVPNKILTEFKDGIEALLGKGMCHILSIRPIGGCEL